MVDRVFKMKVDIHKPHYTTDLLILIIQEAQLSQRDCVMLCMVKNVANTRGRSWSFKMTSMSMAYARSY